MKILVVSLLRLGDIIQQIPLLRGLRSQYPDAEIHLLVNKQFSQIESIVEGLVTEIHYFDRENLQKSIGDARYNILWPYQQISNTLELLNSLEFDRVYNFTHNRLSAYLIGLMHAPAIVGLFYRDGHFLGLSGSWMRYLNERFSGNSHSLFHYVEVLSRALNIPISQDHQVLPFSGKEKIVLFQCLTSDSKKNWKLDRFVALKKTIELALVDYKVRILAAEFEKDRLLRFFDEDDLIICNLAEAQEHLKRARLLVTGDTSIKHLAAQVGTPLVELVLGSSDFLKTRAFTDLAISVKTQAPCAPCTHAQKCYQSSHLCAEDISVEKVFSAVWDILSKESWKPLLPTLVEVERAVWSRYMDQDRHSPLAVIEIDSNVRDEASKKQIELERELFRLQQALLKAAGLSEKSQITADDISEFILVAQNILKSGIDKNTGYFQILTETLLARFVLPEQFYTKMEKAVREITELILIRKEIIHDRSKNFQEGQYYAEQASGTRQLSFESLEEDRKSARRNSQDAGI